MIPDLAWTLWNQSSKPRASGDDPRVDYRALTASL